MTDRRSFLQQSWAAMAATGVLTRVPAHLWHAPAHALFPAIDEARLKALAVTAVDAARQAGARFADVRLTVGRHVSVGAMCFQSNGRKPVAAAPSVSFPVEYGVRVLVGGTWGFGHGAELTTDAITRVARLAVTGAQASQPRHRTTIELAPTPPVPSGRWTTLMKRDPLTVTMAEQTELALAAVTEAAKVQEATNVRADIEWRRPWCVFASSDGSVIVQDISTAWPNAMVLVETGPNLWYDGGDALKTALKGGYGYEALPAAATFPEELRRVAESAVARARVAGRATSVDVGRYDVVLGAPAVADLMVNTLAEPLDMAYALGYEAGGHGVSFAAPPLDMLGRRQVASPLITLKADRTLPNGAASAGWDDEGVPTGECTLVKDGVIVDYLTSRETAMELADWYRANGKPVASNAAMRRGGQMTPAICTPNLSLQPSASNTTVDDLIADTKRGFYIEYAGGQTDQQSISAQYYAPHLAVREIKGGKLGGYIKEVGFQFFTERFWKSVDAIGGTRSVEPVVRLTDFPAFYNILEPFPASTVRAVPIRARQVNVINLGRTA